MNDIPSERSLASQFNGFLNTPPLWNTRELLDIPQFLTKKLDVKKNLPGLKVSPGLILGRRIELFFHYYIEHFSQEEILTANTQISSGKITVGELDFLLRNKSSRSISHIELVYKFYIYDPSMPSETDRWIGPNRRDSLAQKLKKLEEQQFPLLHWPQTQPLLDKFRVRPEEIQQKVCFKANLFVPYPLLGQSFPLINPDCIQGYWIKAREFTASDFGDYLFYSPRKADWPVQPENHFKWFSFANIREQLSVLLEQKRSPLVWMKKGTAEYERFFVVWW